MDLDLNICHIFWSLIEKLRFSEIVYFVLTEMSFTTRAAPPSTHLDSISRATSGLVVFWFGRFEARL